MRPKLKPLHQQVIEYMVWRTSRDAKPYTASDLAADVAKHQNGIADTSRCKRQDIENLIKLEISNPRYIAALAAAMGTTVERMKVGVFDAGADGAHQEVEQPQDDEWSDIDFAQVIDRYIENIDELLVPAAKAALAKFALDKITKEALVTTIKALKVASNALNSSKSTERTARDAG